MIFIISLANTNYNLLDIYLTLFYLTYLLLLAPLILIRILVKQ